MSTKEIVFEVHESPERSYEAQALGHAIFTQGETMNELRSMVQDAVRCHFEDEERPAVIRLHIVKSSQREIAARS